MGIIIEDITDILGSSDLPGAGDTKPGTVGDQVG